VTPEQNLSCLLKMTRGLPQHTVSLQSRLDLREQKQAFNPLIQSSRSEICKPKLSLQNF